MSDGKSKKARLVADVTERLRRRILARPSGEHMGSLNDVAGDLGVGIVTVQQAARILEHEGLLAVKRGPGGGYYGSRPDKDAIERAFATYMRVHDIGYREAFELTVLLDCDLIQAAAAGLDDSQQEKIMGLLEELAAVASAEDRIAFEVDFRETLFTLFHRPLLELLSQVAIQLYTAQSDPNEFADAVPLEDWRTGRRRILNAILARDEALASFEANRFREMVLGWARG